MQHSITLTNDIEQVPQLADFVADFVDMVCEEVGMDMAVAIQMNLAMEEAVVNVMSYAYPADTVGDVTIEAVTIADQLQFTITDCGTPFVLKSVLLAVWVSIWSDN